MTERLTSYASAASVVNVIDVPLLPQFAASPSSAHSSHTPTRWLEKALPMAALAIEGMHVVVPAVLAVSGVGIPASLGTSIVIQGLRLALKKIHHYVHLTEEVVTHYGVDTLIINLNHMHHYAHQAGLFSHEHHDKTSELQLETLRHLHHLLSRASAANVDIVSVLIHHWAAIYQPVTAELNEISNTLLGILLAELVLRGLTLRLVIEKQRLTQKKRVT